MKRFLNAIFCVLFSVLLSAQVSSAQNVVSGKVTDAADGEPLVGVGVSVKGTTQGVFTDINGEYSISVSKNGVLVFSYIGYKDLEVHVSGQKSVNAALELDTNLLDEVVLLGYSSVKKTELSASAVSVSGEKLRDVTTPDLGNMLQGKVSGVAVYNSSGQPGSQATIRIRGTGSISASSDPLYVVDGVAGGSFNPNDVESITVLKDAGATAIYGASAAGGVIVITTKKAKPGQNSYVDFKAQVGVKQALTGRFHQMETPELFDFLTTILPKNTIKNYPSDILERNYNWVDEALRTGITQDYYVSATGSEGKINYMASLNYYDELGTQLGSDFNRVTGRVNLSGKIANNVELVARVNYRLYGSHSGSVLGSAYTELPWDNPRDVNTGEWVDISGQYRPDNGELWWGHDKSNPFFSQSVNSNDSKGNSFTSDLQLTWNISDHFTLSTTNRYNSSNSYYKEVISPESHNGTYPTGRVNQSNSWSHTFSTTNLFRYHQTFNSAHSVTALLGHEWATSRSDYLSASGIGLTNGLAVLEIASPETVGGSPTDCESWSLFGQVQYSYLEKYIANATLRADASSVFAPGNRVGYFPAVSFAWVASSEDFMKNQDVLSFLKVRASLGQTGNSGLAAYSYLDVYALYNTVSYQGNTGAIPSTVSNPLLRWETATMRNIGIDASFKDFLNVTLDLYSNTNSDLLLDVQLSPSSGYESRTENTGVIRNNGIELELSSTNVKTRNFTWSSAFNIGHNRNMVVSLPEHKDIICTSTTGKQLIREGLPLYSWYMPKWAGVDSSNGDPQWEKVLRDAEGNITGTEKTKWYSEAEDQIVGCAQPDFLGGFVNTFNFFNFEVSANLQFVVGNDVFNFTRVVMDSDGSYPDYNQMSLNNGLGWSRWEKEGDIATHPKARNGGNKNSNQITSRYLEDGSYLRLKNVTISYNVPKSVLKKCNLQSARIFLTGDNLLTYTKFSGMDPEVDLSSKLGSWILSGTYYYNYPVARLFSLGVNVKF